MRRVALALLLLVGCSGKSQPAPPAPDAGGAPDAGSGPCTPGGDGSYTTAPYSKLSGYCMVTIEGGEVVPKPGVLPYDLNTPLYSDGATKRRTVWLPAGTSAQYDPDNAFTYPVGTIFTKSFGFRADRRDSGSPVRWMETRVLLNTPSGWQGYTYLWDAAAQEATLDYGGGVHAVSWIDEQGESQTTNYLVPSFNQCKQCHENAGAVKVIGPKARNLNRSYAYAGGAENQLAHWSRTGVLTGAPDPASAPKLPAWDDPSTGTVEARARAYLEVNCAHCHNPEGSARTTGLTLWASETNPTHVGICKPPVAAGAATGGNPFDVVPGQPDHSVLAFRLASTEPSIAMPLIGRSVVDQPGLQLVRDWITQLPGSCP